MNQLVPLGSSTLPEFVAAAGERAGMRFLEFFMGKHPQPALKSPCQASHDRRSNQITRFEIGDIS